MRRRTIDLDSRFGDEYAGHYVFLELTWAKRSRIIQRHTKYNQMTGQVEESDFIAIQAETIWASLIEQPPTKPINLPKLLAEQDGVPIGVGELFSQVANDLNNVGMTETAFLSEPSEGGNRIPHSQTSDSAKNSVGPQKSSPDSQQKPCNSSSLS